jgi:hypothetical protein
MGYKVTTTRKGTTRPDLNKDIAKVESQRQAVSMVKNNLASGATKVLVEEVE